MRGALPGWVWIRAVAVSRLQGEGTLSHSASRASVSPAARARTSADRSAPSIRNTSVRRYPGRWPQPRLTSFLTYSMCGGRTRHCAATARQGSFSFFLGRCDPTSVTPRYGGCSLAHAPTGLECGAKRHGGEVGPVRNSDGIRLETGSGDAFVPGCRTVRQAGVGGEGWNQSRREWCTVRA